MCSSPVGSEIQDLKRRHRRVRKDGESDNCRKRTRQSKRPRKTGEDTQGEGGRSRVLDNTRSKEKKKDPVGR